MKRWIRLRLLAALKRTFAAARRPAAVAKTVALKTADALISPQADAADLLRKHASDDLMASGLSFFKQSGLCPVYICKVVAGGVDVVFVLSEAAKLAAWILAVASGN